MKKVLLLLCAALLQGPTGAEAAGDLLLGVHPFLPATELARKFRPLADYLEGELGRVVRIDISRDYADHRERIAAGDFDLAYLGPASYVRFTGSRGPLPLLARLEVRGQLSFRGVIFTRDDSPVVELKDLAGRSFAFVSPSSTMGYVLPLYMMKQKGLGMAQLSSHGFLHNHENVATAVLVGDFDAGAVKEETYLRYEGRGARIVALTPPIPEHLFVASPALPAPAVEELRAALQRISSRPGGKEALQAIKAEATGLAAAADGDYDFLRTIFRFLEKEAQSP